MSFSSDCKEELCRLSLEKSCCRLRELSALYMTLGTISLLGRGQVNVQFTTESAAIARRVIVLLQKEMQLSVQLHYVTHARFGGTKKCVLTLGPVQSPTLLTALGMMELDHHGMAALRSTSPRVSLNRVCCMRAFLRGALLGCGTVTNPEHAYDLQFSVKDEAFAHALAKCLLRFSFPVQRSKRKDTELFYFKKSEQISDLLSLLGAHQSMLHLSDLRVKKQLLGTVNRAMNCDQANLNKQMDASGYQQRQIALLMQDDRFPGLPPALQEIAFARIQAPDASLAELGEMLNPPISKSGVNHRMRRLMDIANSVISPSFPMNERSPSHDENPL